MRLLKDERGVSTVTYAVLLPLFLLLPALADFPYPSTQALFSDLTISHYPNAEYLRQSLLSGGSLPLWSPGILSGYPFAANPLSGIWYPPGWLALVLPLPHAFNLLPNAGNALPFISYGGTALLVDMSCMGILLSISGQCHFMGKA